MSPSAHIRRQFLIFLVLWTPGIQLHSVSLNNITEQGKHNSVSSLLTGNVFPAPPHPAARNGNRNYPREGKSPEPRVRGSRTHLAPHQHGPKHHLQPVEEVVPDDDHHGSPRGPPLARADGFDAGRGCTERKKPSKHPFMVLF